MSLIDVDKDGLNRDNPTLNTHDAMSPDSVKAHATDGISYRTEDNAGSTPHVITNDDQIILYDGTANKILIGRDGAGRYKVKIAEDGVDVLNATDAQLLFDGDRNTLRVWGNEVLTATINSNTIAPGNVTDTATVDISSFGLTTTPLILAFYTTGGSAVSLGSSPYGGTVIEFIGGTGTLNAFTLLTTAHTSTNAVFRRKFINNSGGNLTVAQYNVAFIICTQTAS